MYRYKKNYYLEKVATHVPEQKKKVTTKQSNVKEVQMNVKCLKK